MTESIEHYHYGDDHVISGHYRGSQAKFYNEHATLCPKCKSKKTYHAYVWNTHHDAIRSFWKCECGAKGYNDIGIAPKDESGMSRDEALPLMCHAKRISTHEYIQEYQERRKG